MKLEELKKLERIEELDERAFQLINHFKDVNGWIECNMGTDPNFFEMIKCLTEYASLASEYYDCCEKSGYITDTYGDDELGASKRYELLSEFDSLNEVRDEVYKMFTLRNDSAFFEDREAKEFSDNLMIQATIGSYNNPEDDRIAEIKKFVLKKVAGVYFYIWQVKQSNPNYQYDNVSEWKELQEAYREYKEAVGKEETKGDYSGPQYGKEIENMFAVIEKNYKFSETKEEQASEEVETTEELEEINRQAEALTNSFRGINSWIEANINTDPNFSEMVDCMVEYGKLTKLYDKYYQKTGYPTFNNGSEEVEATHYHLALASPKLKEAQSELTKMWNLRENSPFFEDETVRKFTDELSLRAKIAEYYVPEDKEIERIKKEILCKTASIYFYIWQVKQTNPDYQYDNEAEWNNLLQAYEIYKDAAKYVGPQFGKEIENMFAVIEKNYKYSDTEEKQY